MRTKKEIQNPLQETGLTARQALLVALRKQIGQLPGDWFFELQKGQFSTYRGPKPALPACLVDFHFVQTGNMTQQVQERQLRVSLYLFLPDAEEDADPEAQFKAALQAMKRIDQVVYAVQGLSGEGFKPLVQKTESSRSQRYRIPACQLDFETWIYEPIKPHYVS